MTANLTDGFRIFQPVYLQPVDSFVIQCFFDEINAALRNDILKIRSRLTDYLLSVLLNSIMANYISTISSIDDALEDLEEELLMITNENDIGIQIQGLRRQYMLMKKAILPLKEQYLVACIQSGKRHSVRMEGKENFGLPYNFYRSDRL